MKSEKSAGLIIFRTEGGNRKFLLLKYTTHWGFVKGNIEKNESEIETTKRECLEETGIKDLKIIPGFKKEENYFYRDVYSGTNELVKKKVVFYLAETDEKKVTISYEHEGFEWLDYEEAIKKIKTKSGSKVLEEAERFLKEEPSLEKWN
jgi:8-oxo-dGTP pyrophosphatase MutT (NUDIX family)